MKAALSFIAMREGVWHLEFPGNFMRNSKNILVATSFIAIVEDDNAVRTGLCNLLKSAGYTTVSFDSSEDFLAFDGIDRLRCAIFDVQLSGMDGLDLQEHLIARHITVPVIFLSAYDFAEIQARAKKNGAVAFLPKPVNIDILLACILHIFESSGHPS